jgi:homoserine O-acetyltransferase
MNKSFFTLFIFTSSLLLFAHDDHDIFDLGNFKLESGEILPNAKLSYVTHGKLNKNRDNLILVPSAYLGDHHGFDYLIEPGKALDPDKYFIVATDMFQNGLSSSPSNTEAPFNGPNFPLISIRDNVYAGYRLITEVFKVKKIKGVVGFSMGAQHAFQWGVSYPNFMEKIVGIAGSAVEYPHGKVRLEGFISAIKADLSFDNGHYNLQPEKGLRAGGTHWASWGWSQGSHFSSYDFFIFSKGFFSVLFDQNSHFRRIIDRTFRCTNKRLSVISHQLNLYNSSLLDVF